MDDFVTKQINSLFLWHTRVVAVLSPQLENCTLDPHVWVERAGVGEWGGCNLTPADWRPERRLTVSVRMRRIVSMCEAL